LATKLQVSYETVRATLTEYLRRADLSPEQDRRRWAAEHIALPLVADDAGTSGLTPDGLIIGYLDRNEAATGPELDPLLVHLARALGHERYPSITGLKPERGPDAAPCPYCHGTGRTAAAAQDPRAVCMCGGLGWVPRECA
jgi:hypothetical protein